MCNGTLYIKATTVNSERPGTVFAGGLPSLNDMKMKQKNAKTKEKLVDTFPGSSQALTIL